MTDLIFSLSSASTPLAVQSATPDSVLAADEHPVLQHARQQAAAARLPFAGSVTPIDAWQLITDGLATLVDVRTNEERFFVGHVPDSTHVAWMTGTSMNRNPRFVKELEGKVKDKSAVILFLCRSGKRSSAAAEAAQKAGFINSFNITEGFEGDLSSSQQRGHLGGWRVYGLPWIQN